MIGPVGRQVIANIEDLRKARGLSFQALAARLAKIGRPIGDTVLHRQSKGQRRIDADDLVAFALVFGVNPNALLLPRDADDDDQMPLAPNIVRQRVGAVWDWADGRMPLPGPDDAATGETPWERAADFQRHARPRGGATEIPPMVEALYDLLHRWEIAYQDWANPDTWEMRLRFLRREGERLRLKSEEELERLESQGGAAERKRLARYQAEHPGATEYPSFKPGPEDFNMITLRPAGED